ncbi:MAG: dihydroxyacetone kinase subunit DhaK [Eubacteriales bacterium]|nr:dihydroxyacetone kinase subunit DhaK [Eubacteriales bacterium]
MRLWNSKESAHEEALQGIMLANPGKYTRLPSEYGYGLYRNNLRDGQVRIIINGGGGYGPMWAGFADNGLADAMVHGNFDSAPNAFVLYEMAKAVDCGCGVLFLTNHFMGDYLNNDMAVELLAHDGIPAKLCCVSDDILSCEGEAKEARGGLHGIGQICKICGAAAREGLSLDEIWGLAEKANSRLRSVSVNIREGMILFGEGFSGEPAVKTSPYQSVDQMVREACGILLEEMEQWRDDSFYLSVNSHCGVGYTESFVILNSAVQWLKEQGLKMWGCGAGTYFDVYEGTGCMISLIACDEEMRKYLHPEKGYGFVI